MTLATPIEPQVRFWLVQECQETICDQQDLEIWCRACEISDGTEFPTQEMLRKWIAAREGWLRENEAWIIQKNSNPLFATRWGWFKVPDILRSILHAFHIVDLNFSRFFHDGFHNKPSKAIIDSIDHPMLRWRIPKTGSPVVTPKRLRCEAARGPSKSLISVQWDGQQPLSCHDIEMIWDD